MLSTRSRLNNKGFSLVELSVVLLIVGLVGGGSFSLYSEQQVHSKWQMSHEKLEVVKKALLEFVRVNKYMPCPDASLAGTGFDTRTNARGMIPEIVAILPIPAIPKTATSPAIPAILYKGAQFSISNIAVSICFANTGTVPYNTIGLSRANVQDSWGNPFIFAVDQGVTSANTMLDCPTQTACFFNRDPKPILPTGKHLPGSVLPAFDLSTQPLKGRLGVNNLQICSGSACTSVQSKGLIAVILAMNKNGTITSGLSVDESENRDGDLTFVNAQYSTIADYDDLVIGISAAEIKVRHEIEIVELFIPVPNHSIMGVNANPNNSGVVSIVGGMGDNSPLGDTIRINIETSMIKFGSNHAGEMVTLSFKAVIDGGWENTQAKDDGINQNESLGVQDIFLVGLNGGNVSYLDGRLVKLEEGVAAFDNHQVIEKFYYDVHLDEDNRWSEYLSYDVDLDSNGDLKIDFVVFSMYADRQVTVTEMNAILYHAPESMPAFPSVDPIMDILETEGLS